MRRIILLTAILLSACDHKGGQPKAPGGGGGGGGGGGQPPPAQVFDSGDAVQAMLADRVSTKFKTGDDFRVLVTDIDYPIGTLMEEGRTVAMSDEACLPAFEVHSYSLPSMFSTISMTGKAAFDLGIDSAATQGMVKFGVKGGQDDVFNLSVSNAAGKFLLDDKLQQLLKQPDCAKTVEGKTLLLVRGYVIGKRIYLLQRARSGGADVGVDHVGALKVDASRSNGVSLSDEAPVEFLQIVSKIAVGPQIAAAPPPPPPPPPPPFPGSTASVVVTTGPVFMQRDVSDTSGNAAKIKDLLSGQSFAVAGIEAIDHAKMPSIAQVRYFNKTDEGLADKAVAVLRQVYPSASKLFVGLKAPQGQLEVWLPKAGAGPGAIKAAAAVGHKVPVAALVAHPH